eukprot:357286-Chlamydomonas_euryale.AAC.17
MPRPGHPARGSTRRRVGAGLGGRSVCTHVRPNRVGLLSLSARASSAKAGIGAVTEANQRSNVAFRQPIGASGLYRHRFAGRKNGSRCHGWSGSGSERAGAGRRSGRRPSERAPAVGAAAVRVEGARDPSTHPACLACRLGPRPSRERTPTA